jgi:hypothetical protein
VTGTLELIAGMATDAVFGPVLSLGEGGTAVELRTNHAVSLPPLNGQLGARYACSKQPGTFDGRLAQQSACRSTGVAGNNAKGIANGL